MPEEIEKRIAELFRNAIEEFPSDLKKFAEQWLAMRQKAVEDVKELASLIHIV